MVEFSIHNKVPTGSRRTFTKYGLATAGLVALGSSGCGNKETSPKAISQAQPSNASSSSNQEAQVSKFSFSKRVVSSKDPVIDKALQSFYDEFSKRGGSLKTNQQTLRFAEDLLHRNITSFLGQVRSLGAQKKAETQYDFLTAIEILAKSMLAEKVDPKQYRKALEQKIDISNQILVENEILPSGESYPNEVIGYARRTATLEEYLGIFRKTVSDMRFFVDLKTEASKQTVDVLSKTYDSYGGLGTFIKQLGLDQKLSAQDSKVDLYTLNDRKISVQGAHVAGRVFINETYLPDFARHYQRLGKKSPMKESEARAIIQANEFAHVLYERALGEKLKQIPDDANFTDLRITVGGKSVQPTPQMVIEYISDLSSFVENSSHLVAMQNHPDAMPSYLLSRTITNNLIDQAFQKLGNNARSGQVIQYIYPQMIGIAKKLTEDLDAYIKKMQ